MSETSILSQLPERRQRVMPSDTDQGSAGNKDISNSRRLREEAKLQGLSAHEYDLYSWFRNGWFPLMVMTLCTWCSYLPISIALLIIVTTAVWFYVYEYKKQFAHALPAALLSLSSVLVEWISCVFYIIEIGSTEVSSSFVGHHVESDTAAASRRTSLVTGSQSKFALQLVYAMICFVLLVSITIRWFLLYIMVEIKRRNYQNVKYEYLLFSAIAVPPLCLSLIIASSTLRSHVHSVSSLSMVSIGVWSHVASAVFVSAYTIYWSSHDDALLSKQSEDANLHIPMSQQDVLSSRSSFFLKLIDSLGVNGSGSNTRLRSSQPSSNNRDADTTSQNTAGQKDTRFLSFPVLSSAQLRLLSAVMTLLPMLSYVLSYRSSMKEGAVIDISTLLSACIASWCAGRAQFRRLIGICSSVILCGFMFRVVLPSLVLGDLQVLSAFRGDIVFLMCAVLFFMAASSFSKAVDMMIFENTEDTTRSTTEQSVGLLRSNISSMLNRTPIPRSNHRREFFRAASAVTTGWILSCIRIYISGNELNSIAEMDQFVILSLVGILNCLAASSVGFVFVTSANNISFMDPLRISVFLAINAFQWFVHEFCLRLTEPGAWHSTAALISVGLGMLLCACGQWIFVSTVRRDDSRISNGTAIDRSRASLSSSQNSVFHASDYSHSVELVSIDIAFRLHMARLLFILPDGVNFFSAFAVVLLCLTAPLPFFLPCGIWDVYSVRGWESRILRFWAIDPNWKPTSMPATRGDDDEPFGNVSESHAVHASDHRDLSLDEGMKIFSLGRLITFGLLLLILGIRLIPILDEFGILSSSIAALIAIMLFLVAAYSINHNYPVAACIVIITFYVLSYPAIIFGALFALYRIPIVHRRISQTQKYVVSGLAGALAACTIVWYLAGLAMSMALALFILFHVTVCTMTIARVLVPRSESVRTAGPGSKASSKFNAVWAFPFMVSLVGAVGTYVFIDWNPSGPLSFVNIFGSVPHGSGTASVIHLLRGELLLTLSASMTALGVVVHIQETWSSVLGQSRAGAKSGVPRSMAGLSRSDSLSASAISLGTRTQKQLKAFLCSCGYFSGCAFSALTLGKYESSLLVLGPVLALADWGNLGLGRAVSGQTAKSPLIAQGHEPRVRLPATPGSWFCERDYAPAISCVVFALVVRSLYVIFMGSDNHHSILYELSVLACCVVSLAHGVLRYFWALGSGPSSRRAWLLMPLNGVPLFLSSVPSTIMLSLLGIGIALVEILSHRLARTKNMKFI